jgi:uncharacterized repeat protein (TIGR03803 family)
MLFNPSRLLADARSASIPLFAGAAVFVAVTGVAPARAAETVLFGFCAQGNCSDGSYPEAGLIMDTAGNLYGTTDAGGANGQGTVFKLAPGGTETVLYSFCEQSNCADGQYPSAGVIMDAEGNLYGTTFNGGAYSQGTVFKLPPGGTETVLYSFCQQSDCTDGANPFGGLIMDAQGNLYGTTRAGGGNGGANGGGTIFKLAPNGTETVLYSFCAQSNCTDGATPFAGLIMDAQGNLYGTTELGGTHGNGTVFKVPHGGTETVLYSFCAQTDCTDGGNPVAGLILDTAGNLYGTTEAGGANGFGTVFKVTPGGTETVLYSFCAQSSQSYSCTDGESPQAGLILDAAGNLYGTTRAGGASGGGAVFKLAPGGTETVLYSFCAQSNCTDGDYPIASLIMNAAGNLYGTTRTGGNGTTGYGMNPGWGTVFEVVLNASHDFNGDGMSDILWRDTSGDVAIWEMNGTTVLNGPSSFVATVSPSTWSIVGQCDFNGDGKTDLLWRDTSGDVAIWLMDGTTVLNGSSSFVATVSPSTWSIYGAGDFFGTGMCGILWRDTSGDVAIWEMNGTTVLNGSSSFVATVSPSTWTIDGVGDFFGTGKAGILWRDTSGDVAIWEMNGTTVLNSSSSFVATVSPSTWSIVGVGDFNGDGKSDILWHSTTGEVVIWEMSGTTVLNASSSYVATVSPSTWSIIQTGDFNGDGMSDILWQDTSGDVAIWEMNGTAVSNSSSTYVSTLSRSTWTIQSLNSEWPP